MIKKILSQLALITLTTSLSVSAQQVDLTKQVKGVLPSANGGVGTVSGIVKANGSGITSAATAGTDYLAPPSGTSILKANSGGALSNATSGTDYAPATSGTSILYGNGSGGFSNVTIGTNLSFAGGTLNAVNVNAGTTGQFAYYAANGSVVSGQDPLCTLVGTLAAGTLITGTSSTTCGYLTVGGNGTLLVSNGTMPTWSSITVPGTNLVGINDQQTLTNKRVSPRIIVGAATASATPTFTPTSDSYDSQDFNSSSASPTTITIASPGGTPTHGQMLQICITNTSANTYSWNAIYKGGSSPALTTTATGGNTQDCFVFSYSVTTTGYTSVSSKWRLISVSLGL